MLSLSRIYYVLLSIRSILQRTARKSPHHKRIHRPTRRDDSPYIQAEFDIRLTPFWSEELSPFIHVCNCVLRSVPHCAAGRYGLCEVQRLSVAKKKGLQGRDIPSEGEDEAQVSQYPPLFAHRGGKNGMPHPSGRLRLQAMWSTVGP